MRAMSRPHRFAAAATAAATALTLGATVSPPAAAESKRTFEVVASGLDNPRQIDFGTRGALYVAEAGQGGSGPCIPGPVGEVCFGRSGAVTRVSPHGVRRRIMERLPSLAAEDGSAAIGPSDVEVRGRHATVSIGLQQDPAVRDQLPPGARLLGHLVRRELTGHRLHVVADIAGFEAASNPDGNEVDSNPTSVKANRRGWVVADAGGNSLVRVNRHGATELLTVFDFLDLPGVDFPVAPVPTSVSRGPDGSRYVGLLTGFPFVEGAAQVIRVRPNGNQTVFAEGLTNVTDVEFRNETLYAVELAEQGLLNGPIGRLVRIDPDGTQTTVAGDLFAPFGLALRKGTAYVSTCSVCPDAGEVIAIPLH